MNRPSGNIPEILISAANEVEMLPGLFPGIIANDKYMNIIFVHNVWSENVDESAASETTSQILEMI